MTTPPTRGLRDSAYEVVGALGFVALFPPLLALFGDLWWPLELTVHFHGCYALYLAPVAVLLWLIRKRSLACAAAVLCVVDLCFVLPLYLGEDEHAATNSPTTRILFANVLTQNNDASDLLDLIERENPACIALFEVDASWMGRLSGLDSRYPWHVAAPRIDNFGIAFWSQLPCSKLDIIKLGAMQLPSVHAALIDDQPASRTPRRRPGLHLIATHPIPPVLHRSPSARVDQLAAVAEYARALNHPGVIVGGDLNTSSWTKDFEQLCELARLRDSRQGFGPQATWPSRLGPVGIAIDHALVGDAITVVDRRVGPHIGSDHRPVLIDVRTGF